MDCRVYMLDCREVAFHALAVLKPGTTSGFTKLMAGRMSSKTSFPEVLWFLPETISSVSRGPMKLIASNKTFLNQTLKQFKSPSKKPVRAS